MVLILTFTGGTSSIPNVTMPTASNTTTTSTTQPCQTQTSGGVTWETRNGEYGIEIDITLPNGLHCSLGPDDSLEQLCQDWTVKRAGEEMAKSTKAKFVFSKDYAGRVFLTPIAPHTSEKRKSSQVFEDSPAKRAKIIVPPYLDFAACWAIVEGLRQIVPICYRHKFCDRVPVLREIFKIIVVNFKNRRSTDHRSHTFIDVSGSPGIGKSRLGWEIGRFPLALMGEHATAALSGLEVATLTTSLSKSTLYIHIDFNNGEAFSSVLDKETTPPHIRMGARIACAAKGSSLSDLLCLPNVTQLLPSLSVKNVLKELVTSRLEDLDRDAVLFVVIHIDEYPYYITSLAADIRSKKPNWTEALDLAIRSFKAMLKTIGEVMRTANADNFFILPICTGTTAGYIEFDLSDYTLMPFTLPRLSRSSAMVISADCFAQDALWPVVCQQNNFQVSLSDTGYVPKYLDYFLGQGKAPVLSRDRDWGEVLQQTDVLRGHTLSEWGGRTVVYTVLCLCFIAEPVSRSLRLQSGATIRDLERKGCIYLEKHSLGGYVISIPICVVRYLIEQLSSEGIHLFPKSLLNPPTSLKPWYWQDFETLYLYIQTLFLKAKVTKTEHYHEVAKREIEVAKRTEQDPNLSPEERDIAYWQYITATTNLEQIVAQQSCYTVQDLFTGAYAHPSILSLQFELSQTRTAQIENKKFLINLSSVAEFSTDVLCETGTYSLYDIVSACKYGNCHIDFRFSCKHVGGEGVHFFVRTRHSQLITDGKLSTTKIEEWYDGCVEALAAYPNKVLVFISNRRWEETVENMHGFFEKRTNLVLVTKENFESVFHLFAERGLLAPEEG